jgi:hypothetical protein
LRLMWAPPCSVGFLSSSLLATPDDIFWFSLSPPTIAISLCCQGEISCYRIDNSTVQILSLFDGLYRIALGLGPIVIFYFYFSKYYCMKKKWEIDKRERERERDIWNRRKSGEISIERICSRYIYRDMRRGAS